MKKINIIFDATVLYDNINSCTAIRSGVYWVAYNMLIQLKSSSLYNVILYDHGFRIGKRDKFLSLFKKIHIYDNDFIKNNISVHLGRLKAAKNIVAIFILCLKIIKNLIHSLITHLLFATSRKKLKNVVVYISSFLTIPKVIKINSSIKKFHVLYDCIAVLKDIPYYEKPDENHSLVKIINELNKETYYFCISECTKKDFLSTAPEKLDQAKMQVTPIASAQSFSPKYDRTLLKNILQKYNVSISDTDQFMFSLCNIDPRKNLIFTIKCFIKFIEKHHIENMYFFLGGGHFKTDYINQFMREISNFKKYQNKILLLGYVDDDDVNIFYSNSLFFTYLSQYEGFGMPPLEAMQAGTPVICSNNSSLPEVVGDAAITITYNDEDACIKAFEDLYFNQSLRNEYIAKGLERAKLFSWEKTFKIMSDKIIELLET